MVVIHTEHARRMWILSRGSIRIIRKSNITEIPNKKIVAVN